MPDLDPGPLLRVAGQRLVRTVDALPDDAWPAPSLLPGWSRAHVVAHLALNAEALAGCVEGVLAGEEVPMYPSNEARDADIHDLAADPAAELRERLLGSTTLVTDALARLAQAAQERPEVLDVRVERDPGGQTFPVGGVAERRLREVEIHHVDLDAGYRSADWDPAFSALVLDTMAARPTPVTDAVLSPSDHDGRWSLGSGGPVVSGPLHALAWWATGRPAGPELTSDSGAMPRVENW